MAKIILTEKELKNLIYGSTKKTINEIFSTGGNIGNFKLDYLWGADRYKYKPDDENKVNGEKSQNYVNKEVSDKQNYGVGFGTPTKKTYDDNNVVMLHFVNDNYRETIKGHYIAKEDFDKGKSPIYKAITTIESRTNLNDKKQALANWLTNRDKYFNKQGGLCNLNENVNENPLAVGRAIGRGIKTLNNARKMKRIGNALSSVTGNQTKTKEIETQTLPLILNALCSVLSIEKEDPMYAMITSKETRKQIMKIIERNL